MKKEIIKRLTRESALNEIEATDIVDVLGIDADYSIVMDLANKGYHFGDGLLSCYNKARIEKMYGNDYHTGAKDGAKIAGLFYGVVGLVLGILIGWMI